MTDNRSVQITDNGSLRSKSPTKWLGGFLVAFLFPACFFLHARYGYPLCGALTQAVLLSIARILLMTSPVNFQILEAERGRIAVNAARVTAEMVSFALTYAALSYFNQGLAPLIR